MRWTMDSIDPVMYSLDIRDLGTKGFEVVVSIVNEGEDWLVIKQASVAIAKDGESFGRHQFSFTKVDRSGVVKLGQFEIAEGHFHLNQDLDHRSFEFQVEIAYKYGDHDDTKRISRQVETQRITKKKWWS